MAITSGINTAKESVKFARDLVVYFSMKDLSNELRKIANKLAAIGTPEEERVEREKELKDPFMQGLRERMDPKMRGLRERMREAPPVRLTQDVPMDSFSKALGAYAEAAIWSSLDDEGEPLDHEHFKGVGAFSGEAQAEMKKDLKAFLAWTEHTFPQQRFPVAEIARDFWLTRNGHGTGFWDNQGKSWDDDAAKTMTDMAKKFGEQHVYVGDDGRLHLF